MKQPPYNPLRRFRLLLFMAVLLPIVSALSGCSAAPAATPSSQVGMAPMSDMPAEIQNAPVSVSDAYRFAVANPDALKNVPCYCGCGKVGHTSNYSCYVKEVKPNGEVVFDQHALGCGICVDIAQDVMKMTRAGKSPNDIRAAIDQTYAQYGPSNMAPAP
jgi:hypothetical protein